MQRRDRRSRQTSVVSLTILVVIAAISIGITTMQSSSSGASRSSGQGVEDQFDPQFLKQSIKSILTSKEKMKQLISEIKANGVEARSARSDGRPAPKPPPGFQRSTVLDVVNEGDPRLSQWARKGRRFKNNKRDGLPGKTSYRAGREQLPKARSATDPYAICVSQDADRCHTFPKGERVDPHLIDKVVQIKAGGIEQSTKFIYALAKINSADDPSSTDLNRRLKAYSIDALILRPYGYNQWLVRLPTDEQKIKRFASGLKGLLRVELIKKEDKTGPDTYRLTNLIENNTSLYRGVNSLPGTIFYADQATFPQCKKALATSGVRFGVNYNEIYRGLNFVSAVMPKNSLEQVLDEDCVLSFSLDRPFRFMLNEAVPETSADYLRSSEPGYHVEGGPTGWIDTGVNQNHQAFSRQKQHMCGQDFVGPPQSQGPWDDTIGHGTLVFGAAAGFDNVNGDHRFTGFAPSFATSSNTNTRHAKVGGDNFFVIATRIEQALLWMRQPDSFCFNSSGQKFISKQPGAINISLGSKDGSFSRLTDLVTQQVFETGQLMVISAGNELVDIMDPAPPPAGPYTIHDPGASPNAITVGASGLILRDTGKVQPFSSRGPTRDERMKPDVIAPGEFVDGPKPDDVNGFKTVRGTSIAAPAVTAQASKLREVYKDADLPEEAIVAAIMATANSKSIQDIGNDQGFGNIDYVKSAWSNDKDQQGNPRPGWKNYIAGTSLNPDNRLRKYRSFDIPNNAKRLITVLKYFEPSRGNGYGAAPQVINRVKLFIDIDCDLANENDPAVIEQQAEYKSTVANDNVQWIAIDDPPRNRSACIYVYLDHLEPETPAGIEFGMFTHIALGDTKPQIDWSHQPQSVNTSCGDDFSLRVTARPLSYQAFDVFADMEGADGRGVFGRGVANYLKDGLAPVNEDNNFTVMGNIPVGDSRTVRFDFEAHRETDTNMPLKVFARNSADFDSNPPDGIKTIMVPLKIGPAAGSSPNPSGNDTPGEGSAPPLLPGPDGTPKGEVWSKGLDVSWDPNSIPENCRPHGPDTKYVVEYKVKGSADGWVEKALENDQVQAKIEGVSPGATYALRFLICKFRNGIRGDCGSVFKFAYAVARPYLPKAAGFACSLITKSRIGCSWVDAIADEILPGPPKPGGKELDVDVKTKLYLDRVDNPHVPLIEAGTVTEVDGQPEIKEETIDLSEFEDLQDGTYRLSAEQSNQDGDYGPMTYSPQYFQINDGEVVDRQRQPVPGQFDFGFDIDLGRLTISVIHDLIDYDFQPGCICGYDYPLQMFDEVVTEALKDYADSIGNVKNTDARN